MSDSIYQKIYSVYTVTCLIDNMIYVGFSEDPIKRLQKHKSDAIRGSMCYLHRSMRKHGFENFVQEIVYQSKDGENCLREWEPYFIRKYNSFRPHGYNLTLGGEGMIGHKQTEEHTKKIRDANTGKKRTKEQKKRMSKNHFDVTGKNNPNYGIPCSKEKKQKISKSVSGTNNPNYGRIPWNKGKKSSKESILKGIETKKRNREAKKNL